MKTAFCLAIAMAFSAVNLASAGIVQFEAVDIRANGQVFGTFDMDFVANSSTDGNPLAIAFTVNNQDFDGDGVGDTFSFDLLATSGDPNDTVRTFGQGIDSGFGDLNDITVSVANVSGTTSLGETISFDGFFGGGFAAFEFSGTPPNRAATVNGILLVAPATGIGGTTQSPDFDPLTTPTINFNNAPVPTGTELGTRVIRTLDFQFSSAPPAAIPEPSSLGLLGLSALGLVARRRRS